MRWIASVIAAIALVQVGWVAGECETIRVGSTGAVVRSLEILVEAFHAQNPGIRVVVVPGLGSRGAKRALLAGEVGVAVSAEALSPAERAQGLVAEEFARTPFVFATSRHNPVVGLTLKALVDIYAGRTVTWPDSTRLRLVLRPRSDTDTLTLKAISAEMREAVESAEGRPGIALAQTDQDALDAIQTIPGSLGTSTLALIVSERRPVKALEVDGVAPTPQALARGQYPFFKTFQLVTGREAQPPVRRLVAFLCSPRSREELASLGYLVR